MYNPKYGNQVVKKGTGLGRAFCTNPNCDKRVTVIYTAPAADIKVRDLDTGEESKGRGFDPIAAQETIIVSGHNCVLGQQQR